MKTVVVFEECAHQPTGFFVDALREAFARAPELDAEVLSIPSFRTPAQNVSVMLACHRIFATIRQHKAEKGALFMSSTIQTSRGVLAFQGHVVLSATRTHLLKVSLAHASGTHINHPVMQEFIRRVEKDLALKFPFTRLSDADEAWLKDLITSFSQGMNLAASRFSVHSGRA